ncbi:MAG TPA: ATP-binding protein [Stellaceae bacterium]|nr:ATP-binding protein [Stellaceae bacterium]
MPLALRLIFLVAGALLFSLLAGGVLIFVGAAEWVQAEVDNSSQVAHELVDQRLAEAAEEGESPERLTELLASLETDYRLHAVYETEGQAPPETRAAPAPRSRLSLLLGVHPTVQAIPVAVAGLPPGRIVLTIDPEPEVARVWRAVELSLAAITLISTATLILVAIGLTRSLRPLRQLTEALSRVGTGDYSPRIDTAGPREIALLGRQFNLMADQLRHMRTRTRALDAEMAAVRERERREIARDLHDELGPCLLAANLDVAAVDRLNRGGDRRAVADCAAGLATALARMQDLVRRMIDRLHLDPADTVDLPASIGDLVTFWQERCPEIEWRTDLHAAGEDMPDVAALALLRVAQEALANAVRHSGAAHIAVAFAAEEAGFVLTVMDDGAGMAPDTRDGVGIAGMRERIVTLGGRLEVRSGPGRGTTIVASLPRFEHRLAGPEPLEVTA